MLTRPLSPKQRALRDRDQLVLQTARGVLLAEGYYGMTMERVAAACDCPKGTLYQRFTCKEDIVLALAQGCLEKRLALMRRGAAYPGRTREKLAGLGEGVAVFVRLSPGDSRIVHNAGGPIREKGSEIRVEAIEHVERATIRLLRDIVQEAVASKDLVLNGGDTAERIAFGIAALADGSYSLTELGLPQEALGLANPVQELWWCHNALADAYGWRPLLGEQDWEETLADIRRTIFPEEAQRLYGEGCWYGDAGNTHPGWGHVSGVQGKQA